MKNITISVPEELLDAVTQRAREMKLSVNRFVREVLIRETGSGSKGWADNHKKIVEGIHGNPEPDWKWNRDENYEERLGKFS